MIQGRGPMPFPPIVENRNGGMREATLREKLDVARAFAQAAKDAPVWSKGQAVEQMVETVLLLLADIVAILEKEPKA